MDMTCIMHLCDRDICALQHSLQEHSIDGHAQLRLDILFLDQELSKGTPVSEYLMNPVVIVHSHVGFVNVCKADQGLAETLLHSSDLLANHVRLSVRNQNFKSGVTVT